MAERASGSASTDAPVRRTGERQKARSDSWGAYAEAGTIPLANQGFGLVWNRPTAERALDHAVAKCVEGGYPREECTELLIVFSLSLTPGTQRTDFGPYRDVGTYATRCIAVTQHWDDIWHTAVNSKEEARAYIEKWERNDTDGSFITHAIECNEPRREFRRLFSVSHAASAVCSVCR